MNAGDGSPLRPAEVGCDFSRQLRARCVGRSHGGIPFYFREFPGSTGFDKKYFCSLMAFMVHITAASDVAFGRMNIVFVSIYVTTVVSQSVALAADNVVEKGGSAGDRSMVSMLRTRLCINHIINATKLWRNNCKFLPAIRKFEQR